MTSSHQPPCSSVQKSCEESIHESTGTLLQTMHIAHSLQHVCGMLMLRAAAANSRVCVLPSPSSFMGCLRPGPGCKYANAAGPINRSCWASCGMIQRKRATTGRGRMRMMMRRATTPQQRPGMRLMSHLLELETTLVRSSCIQVSLRLRNRDYACLAARAQEFLISGRLLHVFVCMY